MTYYRIADFRKNIMSDYIEIEAPTAKKAVELFLKSNGESIKIKKYSKKNFAIESFSTEPFYYNSEGKKCRDWDKRQIFFSIMENK